MNSEHEHKAPKFERLKAASATPPTPPSTPFPFLGPPGTEPSEADSPIVKAISDAARELVRLRDAWLNPPGISEADLKDRTLTKLYNLRAAGKCAWLENAHRALDLAVFAAYGWPSELNGQDLAKEEILSRLLTLNHARAAAPTPTKSPKRTAPNRPHP